ncbi:hypothetical protein BBJ28_00022188 [Nothophytophthora sp. Chile5]|nr:hypothetical protein BBJ28_00022188 [Nothophytophthora sp. Chile5]
MPSKGKTSGAKAPAKKTVVKTRSSSAKAKAKAQTLSGVNTSNVEAPQASSSDLEDREPIPRKAITPVAAVSASADARGASAPETPIGSPIRLTDGQATPKTKTWGEEFMADLGRPMDPESSPEPEGSTSHGQASASDAEDKLSVEANLSRSSAAASVPPPADPKITFQEWKAQRAGRSSAPAAGGARDAKKRPTSLSPPRETGASRRTRHVPGKHGELFYQSEDSHDESYEGSPREEGEVAQPHSSEVASNHLNEQQEGYLSARRSQFAEMRTPVTG